MKTLILMRHAKSSWTSPGQRDHDRPLNKRGREAAPIMGRWLVTEGITPDCVLCSTAARVRETFDYLLSTAPNLTPPQFHDDLYAAIPEGMHGHVQRLPDVVSTALLIAHEPGLSSYSQWLGGANAPAQCRRAYGHFPTAAMAVFRAQLDRWRDFRPATAQFTDFAVPREISSNA